MSIFRNTFTKEVRKQLEVRQNALKSRNPQAIQQLNARNAWVRMTSGVDVATKPKLAEQYILQGGVLLDKKLRSGISTSTGAYNIKTPGGTDYQRGIRPMPGITSVDIKSASAYGSLREVTVNFVCHDIAQLEDLELLYMRPGYTVLIEWGWLPYLNNEGNIVNIIDFYDDVLKGGKDFPTILSDLFQRSKQHHGNYDATYGYVKNYNWTARMDGGYDCQTTIISIGEILESLKVNITSFDINDRKDSIGILFGSRYTINQTLPGFENNPIANQTVTVTENTNSSLKLPLLIDNYAENTLVGLLYELITFVQSEFSLKKKENKIISTTHTDPNGITYDLLGLDYPTADTTSNKTPLTAACKSYITLESFIKLLNNYVILETESGNGSYSPIVELSTKPNEYDAENLSPEAKESLLCLAHPLQVSVDVDVCLITSPTYAKGFDVKINEEIKEIENGQENNSSGFDTDAEDIYNQLAKVGAGSEDDIARDLINNKLAFGKPGYNIERARSFAQAFYNVAKRNFKPLGSEPAFTPDTAFRKINALYSGGTGKNNIKSVLTSEELKNFQSTIDILFSKSTYENFAKNQPTTTASTTNGGITTTTTTFFPIDYLNEMQTNANVKKFEYGTGKDELGKIGNIYLNMDNLQQLARNTDGTSSEKKEIKLYDYLKKVLSQVQESIGNVNNFDIHTDPVDSKARIIDINYTDTPSAKLELYKNVFKIGIANTSGSVRSYNLQSQIFPEQSAMVSISAQVGGGGEQGLQNNTLLDFNRGVTDRIIAKKIDPISNISPAKSDSAKLEKLKSSLISLQNFITPKTTTQVATTQDTDTNVSSKYKAALRDMIAYVQGITNAQSKNRAIIPVKISLTMDGIGGLVIGHLFQFPYELLPAGYKFDNTEVGAKLLQTVMRLGHKIENNDWTTTIEAYNIVFNDPSGTLTIDDLLSEGTLTIPPAPPGTSGGGATPNATKLILDLTRNNIALIKGTEVNNGGEIEQGIANAAYDVLSIIKKQYPNITLTVTAGNDQYHQEKPNNSNHKVGKAIDFTIFPDTQDNRNKVVAILENYKKNNPLFKYLDEYSRLSEYASGKHYHMSYNVNTAGA